MALLLVLLQMAVALGGRVAEELIFGEDDITTGASGDFQQVTRTARLMVTQLGFSKKLGQVRALTTRCIAYLFGVWWGWCG
jgi:cell division protease FtsH